MSDDMYKAVKKVLSNVRSIKAFVQKNDYDFILEAHEKLGSLLEERRKEHEAEKAELEEREKQRFELISLVEEAGFDISTLAIPVTAEQKKKKGKSSGTPLEPKYQFTENGETKFWAGVGRKPNPIKKAIEAGKSLDDFLIK